MPTITPASSSTNINNVQFKQQAATPTTPSSLFARLFYGVQRAFGWVSDTGLVRYITGVMLTTLTTTTVASSIAATSIIDSGVGLAIGTRTIPANEVAVGTTFRILARGIVSTTGTPTLTLFLKLGASTLITTGAVTMPAGVTNVGWSAEILITVRAIGASGSVVAQGQVLLNTGTIMGLPETSADTIDFTASKQWDLQAQWGTSSPSNSLSCTNAVIEILN